MTTTEKKEANRNSRDSETHDKQARRQPWRPVRKLETPPPPPGYTYRWIRAEMLGEEDRSNVSRRLREGFELVRSEEIGDFELPSLQDGKHAGVVSVGGLLLAKIPEETRNERNAYYRNKTETAQQAVDNDLMKESDARSPIMSPRRTSSVTFGGGKRK